MAPLVLGRLSGKHALTETNRLVELPAHINQNLHFPAKASGSYRLELSISTDNYADPNPENNAIPLEGDFQVTQWQAPKLTVLSRSEPPMHGLTLEIQSGVRYNEAYGNNWRFIDDSSYLGFQFDSESSGWATLTLRHLVSTSSNCTAPNTAPLAVLVNGHLQATEVSTQPPNETQPWTDAQLTIPVNQGTNHLDLIAGELCSHLWLQAVSINPIQDEDLISAKPKQLPIQSLDIVRCRALRNLAKAHIKAGNYPHSEQLVRLGQQLPEYNHDLAWQTESLALLARTAFLRNDIEQTGAIAKSLLAHEGINDDYSNRIIAMDLLAQSYSETKQSDLAIQTLEVLLKIEPNDLEFQVDIRMRLGAEHLATHQAQLAKDWALKARDMIPKGKMTGPRIQLTHFISVCDQVLLLQAPTKTVNAPKSATEIVDKLWNNDFVAAAIKADPNGPISISLQHHAAASELFLSQNYDESHALTLQAIEALKGTPHTEMLTHLYISLAACDMRRERWKPAIIPLKTAITHSLQTEARIGDPIIRANTGSRDFTAYFLLARCYEKLEFPATSFQTLELGQSRTLATQISAGTAVHSSLVTPAMPAFPRDEVDGLEQISSTLSQITRELPAENKVLFVQFSLGDEYSSVYTIEPRENAPPRIAITNLRTNRHRVDILVKRLRNRMIRKPEQLKFAEAEELASILLSPIEPQLSTLTTNDLLCIIPSGVLWNLPFGALPTSNGALGDRHPMSLTPSLHTLAQIRTRKAESNTGLTLALLAPQHPNQTEGVSAKFLGTLDPIVGIEQLDQSMTEASYPLLQKERGSRATETVFKQQAEQASEIYLATHGVFHAYDHSRTGILLAADDVNDGFLSVAEILDLRLQSELAFVAACHSGEGQSLAGEGALGLSWALMVAGNDSNLVALYRVAAQNTFNLVQGFQEHYRRIKGTHPFAKAQALFEARQTMTQFTERNRPFYKDGIVLIGDWR